MENPTAPDSKPALRLAFSVDESAEILGIGSSLAKELIRTGELRSIKVGRRRLVAWADLETFVDHRRNAA
ncbi:MAG: helix-turn-helix domain-containing protein [Actinomycetota bacterium]